LFAWGRGDDGQLGTGELSNTHTPKRVRLAGCDIELIACGWSHSAASIYTDAQESEADNAGK
jgi:alpha-tubulin suppressor-like RCC1 family protein